MCKIINVLVAIIDVTQADMSLLAILSILI